MPEFRHDPLTDVTVVVAPERAQRPDTFRRPPVPLPANVASCPFCPGNEADTPPEVARTGRGAPDGAGWRVRVVPNLYPIAGHGPRDPASDASAADPVVGAHEVVVLSPAHDRPFDLLSPDECVEALRMVRDRAAAHVAAGRRHVQAFVNHGREAGASIEHPHAQLVALDRLPPAVEAWRRRAVASGRDLLADQQAVASASGLGVLDGPAPAWCPPAATGPFEVVVTHRAADGAFESADDTVVAEVAGSMRTLLARLRDVVGDVPYNVVVQAPGVDPPPHVRWYVRITPRVTVRAGFEAGTGILVNVVAPEAAAAALRGATR